MIATTYHPHQSMTSEIFGASDMFCLYIELMTIFMVV